MTHIDFTLREQELAGIISDHIMDIPDLQRHCHLVALAHSGITEEEFTQNIERQDEQVLGLLETGESQQRFDETLKYKLYWSMYNTTMQRITLLSVASWYNPQISN